LKVIAPPSLPSILNCPLLAEGFAPVPSVSTATENCVLLALFVLSKANAPPTSSDVPL
jgi:hypothetical protein